MFDPATITGPAAALAAGFVTGMHCIGMCGPLACAFVPKPEEKANIYTVTTIYHSARILAYTIIGALAGAIGAAPLAYFQDSALHYLPWALVLFFLAVGLGLEQRLPKPKAVSRAFFKLSLKTSKLPREASALLLGLVTPFLPCGPLYLIFGVAMVTGSAAAGAEFLLAFAIGTLPLIWLAHTQYVRIQQKISPLWMRRIQRAMALILALMIAWRLYYGETHDVIASGDCPMCG